MKTNRRVYTEIGLSRVVRTYFSRYRDREHETRTDPRTRTRGALLPVSRRDRRKCIRSLLFASETFLVELYVSSGEWKGAWKKHAEKMACAGPSVRQRRIHAPFTVRACICYAVPANDAREYSPARYERSTSTGRAEETRPFWTAYSRR